MYIIIDNGHGMDTPGKRSPIYDGKQVFEWRFTRDIANKIFYKLMSQGINCKLLVPELNDISLGERCRRANEEYIKHPDSILISIHANAGGGTGWECFTSVGNTKSDLYATIISNEFKMMFPEKKMRFDYSDKDPDKEENFYILKNTSCPAILLENFFMDNQDDFNLIISDWGKEKIANTIVNSIKKFGVV